MNLWNEYAQLNRIVAALVLVAILVLLALNALWSEWPFVLIPIAVSPMAFVGALLIARVPRNIVGWLLAASGLAFAGSFALSHRPTFFPSPPYSGASTFRFASLL